MTSRRRRIAVTPKIATGCTYICLPGRLGKYAQLLNDASEIRFREGGQVGHHLAPASSDTVILELPVVKPPVLVPVIELFLK